MIHRGEDDAPALYEEDHNGEYIMPDTYRECNICLDDYEDGDELILFPCLKHRVHMECYKDKCEIDLASARK